MRLVRLTLLLSCLAAVLVPAQATAAEYSFYTPDPITIPHQGLASPYPSAVFVSGARGPVSDIEVHLHGLNHQTPAHLDLLLVAPDGRWLPLMSDACGSEDFVAKELIIKSESPFVPAMPEEESCYRQYYRATDFGLPLHDWWPSAGSTSRAAYLSDLHGKAMSGAWKLFIVDDTYFTGGSVAGGWALRLTTDPVETFVPAQGTDGPAAQYPLTRTVSGQQGVIGDVDVRLPWLAHDLPDDLDMLLVGPHGQTAMLMSDACGAFKTDQPIAFDDEAATRLPDDTSPYACGGTVRPTDFGEPERLPAPAPAGPYGTRLDAFDGTDPNGDWRLYVRDDGLGGEGYVQYPFELTIKTRPVAPAAFTETAVELEEGATRAVTIRRAVSDGEVGAARVGVVTAPATAAAGEDFTPIRGEAEFAPGQRERTVTLDALADGAVEPAESYTLTLIDPAGDMALDPATATLTATIAATPPQPDGGGPGDGGTGGGSGNGSTVQACAGRSATIVGTPGPDVLRGTSGPDVIVALAGADVVKGAGGDDVVCAGGGADRVRGGAGDDRLAGGAGRDLLLGGAGRDRLIGGPGADVARP